MKQVFHLKNATAKNVCKKLLFSAAIVLSLTATSQNTFPTDGNVGIGTGTPEKALDVRGDVNIENILFLKEKLKVGSNDKILTMKYVPGNENYPDMFKFSPPEGSGPLGGGAGGVANEDSAPDLSCFNNSTVQIPGFANCFSQMLSVAYNPTNTAFTGGQILLGHNGVNAFIETQGTGTSGSTNPGDLLINKLCNRNVLMFEQPAFGYGETNIFSVGGSFNLTGVQQIGVPGSNFANFDNKLHVYCNGGGAAGTGANGIRIKHVGAANINRYALQVVTYSNYIAFAVNTTTHAGPGSAFDSNVAFKIMGNGKTNVGYQSGASNTATLNVNVNGGNAIEVFDQTSNNVNFKVQASGKTYIGTQYANPSGTHADAMLSVDGKILAKSIFVNIHSSNWADYVFDENYKLMPLNEVQAYVTKHKHLPNVPSAKDLTETDDYNLNLADMHKIQMEKIEELYLYMFEQQKQIDELKRENEQLQILIKK